MMAIVEIKPISPAIRAIILTNRLEGTKKLMFTGKFIHFVR